MKKKRAQIELSLVLPCYNESEHIEKSVPQIIKELSKNKSPFEIIFVEDKSTDDTKIKLKKIISKYPKKRLSVIWQRKNYGRGYAVMTGIKKARGKIVGYIDIDLEISPKYIALAVNKIKSEYDVVCAFRTYDFRAAAFMRWLASKVYRRISQIILNHSVQDTESGYKFFRKKAALKLIKKTQDKHWFWDTEVMVYAQRMNFDIYEQKVRFIRREDKTSTVKLIPDTVEYIKRLLEFRKKINNEKLS